MTAANNPPGPGRPTAPGAGPASREPQHDPDRRDPGPHDHGRPPAPEGLLSPLPPGPPATPERPPRRPGREIKIGLLVTLGTAVLGLAVGLFWLWLAPKVPLYADSKAVYLKDPEGEQRAGADGVFTLLGLAAGAASALVAFLLTRRRGGGIAVAVGLALGGLVGSVIAWRLGVALGPTSDIVAHAKQVGRGKVFDAALQLGATSALLVWPMVAMVLLLALTAVFGKRENQPLPYWQGAPMPPAPGPGDHPAPTG